MLQDLYLRMAAHSDNFYRTFVLADGGDVHVRAPYSTSGVAHGAMFFLMLVVVSLQRSLLISNPVCTREYGD